MVLLSNITTDDNPLLNIQVGDENASPPNSGVEGFDETPLSVPNEEIVTITPSSELNEEPINILAAQLTLDNNTQSVTIKILGTSDNVLNTIVVSDWDRSKAQ